MSKPRLRLSVISRPAASGIAPCACALSMLVAAFGASACAQPAPPSAPATAEAAATDAATTDAGAAMAAAHSHDTPAASPAVGRPGGSHKVTTETVVYGEVGGKPIRGLLARPEGAPTDGPGLILVHEWWGLNDNIRDFARQFASHGYTTLAVDLYGGAVATTPDEATKLMQGVLQNMAPAEENLKQAARYLHGTAATGKVGVVGWCFGGGWSLQTALLVPDQIDADVVYYGHLETDPAKLARLKAPVLGFFGAEDKSIPVASVREFESQLRKLGKSVEVHVYPGAGHAFANASGGSYVKAAADEAWKLTLDFLDKHLKGG